MLITLEGIEGSGKSTQIKRITAHLEKQGRRCVTTREPGDTPIGKKIRAILLDPENSELTSLAELFLYAADRAQHLGERVLPRLAAGDVVVSDRFFDATTAYQGYARGLDLEVIEKIHGMVLKGLRPDLTLLLDLPPEVGLGRAISAIESGDRTVSESRFEQEALAFHEKVRAGYLTLARREPDRFVIIDATLSPDEVTEAVTRAIDERLART
ncbi:dTMP kinase [Desulfoluna butyratoxydans]|uniref:Thymidylate kinase n=1 Tax=Desulfoluna butyratoxydans TaxID=231438 RepID=A0A4U8YQB1_9BACT|nr:dTMP kinase [Desulfoluna butyratoxydans]VFQ46010.1 thymidylate kinase [Desulfoluna butyratoxydans]